MEIYLYFVTPQSLKGVDWLAPREAQTLQKIKAATHREDWLAGRLAAKKLIQRYFLETAGLELALSQIGIVNDENGAPCLDLTPWPSSLSGEEFISLAHSAGHGLAGFSPHGPIGVDLQHIRPVRPDLAERVLTEHEQTQLITHFGEQEGLLVLWALKEAAIKAQRTRPAPRFSEIGVTVIEPGRAEVCIKDKKLSARWGQCEGFIWACVQS